MDEYVLAVHVRTAKLFGRFQSLVFLDLDTRSLARFLVVRNRKSYFLKYFPTIAFTVMPSQFGADC